MEIITGVDLIRSTIEASLGLDNLPLSHDVKEKFVSTYILHSEYDGVLKDINFSENIKGNVFKISLNEQIGDRVEKFINADKLIGIVFLQFDSLEEMKYKLEHIKELIKVKLSK